ncbi:hypothetical protein N0V88_004773 [Collariella sp. IMI 366227]|nr:hypothetical protein N0V88_004773 [Collariella sp. IMI 366227]
MRFPTLPLAAAALLLATGVQADDCTSVALAEIPSCAQPCFLDNAPSIGCGGLDFACQCKQQAALYAAIENCVASSCPASEFQNVIDGADAGLVCLVASLYAADVANAPSNGYHDEGGWGQWGGGGGSPTRSVPSNQATSSVISGADRQSRSGTRFGAGAFVAALAFAII